MPQPKTAIIIKGNPVLIEHNSRADIFYADLANFLATLGYEASFDAGEPYTTPPVADLWIGHSRGSDRLRFASEGTIVIGIGVPNSTSGNDFSVVNHPDDRMVQRVYSEGKIFKGKTDDEFDDAYHYVLTDEMKRKIESIIEDKKSDRPEGLPR